MPNPSTSRVATNAKYCPLAVDEDGNALAVPPEAAFWRVRRDTGGRPRIVNGPDLKPLTLPLEFPPEELLHLLGRGSYRLDLYDDAGQHLETVALKLGPQEPELRNRADNDEQQPAPMSSLPATGSDVRLVLEAQVRATQLAFQHNERTLAASLKIAETLRDGVHVLAESQADWIKSLAASRGFFRNAFAAPMLVPTPPAAATDATAEASDEEEAEDEEVVEVDRPAWVELLKPAVDKLADTASTLIVGAAQARFAGGSKPARSDAPVANGNAPCTARTNEDLASRGFELRELLNPNYAFEKGQAKRAARAAQQEAAANTRSEDELRARVMNDPEVFPKLMQVNVQLRPDETERVMTLVKNSSIQQQELFLSQIKTLTVEEAVATIRCLLEDCERQTQQTDASAPEQAP